MKSTRRDFLKVSAAATGVVLMSGVLTSNIRLEKSGS